MTGLSLVDGAAIVSAYDFSGLNRIVDVGDGYGTLVMMISQVVPKATVTAARAALHRFIG